MSTPLPFVQVTLEFGQTASALPLMRWERSAAAEPDAPFLLLGRAFEMAREHSPADFSTALSAFLKGAMLDKQDILDALGNA
jgi:hypothetical protein